MMLIIMAITVSAASNADFRYQLDQQGTAVTTVVKDVPFSVDMEMLVSSSNSNNNVRDLLLHTSGTGFGAGEPVFVSGTRGAWLPSAGNPDQNRLLSGNIRQYMFTAAHGTVDTTKDTFRKVMQLEVKATTSGQITLASAGVTNIVGGNIETFTIGTIIPLAVDPQNSRCNDRVVGYIDANNNGRKDAGELNEACDDGNTEGSAASNRYAGSKDGCSSDCKVVDLGWDCANKYFGDRLSVCSALSAREFLVQKLTALINGQCYPDCQHPAAMYMEESASTPRLTYDNDGKLDTSEKIYLIAQIGTALREFFSQTLQTTAGS